MPEIRYTTTTPIPASEVEPGDQIHSPYGYRVVFDAVEERDTIRFFFWDEEPIVRPATAMVNTKRRLP